MEKLFDHIVSVPSVDSTMVRLSSKQKHTRRKKKNNMKTPLDPRHLNRINLMQSLFSYSFHKFNSQTNEVLKIIRLLPQIDAAIFEAAPIFPIERIAKVDLAILRLAVYELLNVRRNPPKVIIDEAVELAKEFGGDTSASFVNGVLGTIFQRGNPAPLSEKAGAG